MRIAILGAGAMGMLLGGYLSEQNQVWLLDIDKNRIEKIQADGVTIREANEDRVFYPHAATSADGLGEMELVLVFVKAMYTVEALETNRSLIGRDTYLMTLQNGAGHEAKLLQFADADHVIVGTTQHNSSIIDNGCVCHGGGGRSVIGLLGGNSERIQHIARALSDCGFDCSTSDDVKRQIWDKLFLNTAASSLTAVLQVPLGFILDDPHAGSLMERLAREAVAVANAEGFTSFYAEDVINDIRTVLRNAKNGYTSIYADIRDGKRSEVDTISGSVVDTAHRFGVPVPCHEMVVALIHAIEDKARVHI